MITDTGSKQLQAMRVINEASEQNEKNQKAN